MRTCSKMHCSAFPDDATVALIYGSREVLVGDLAPHPDPNLLDLCAEHVARMSPPRGWTILDERTPARAAAR